VWAAELPSREPAVEQDESHGERDENSAPGLHASELPLEERHRDVGNRQLVHDAARVGHDVPTVCGELVEFVSGVLLKIVIRRLATDALTTVR